MRKRFTRALARPSHKAELSDPVHRHPSAVARERLAEFSQHGVPVLFGVHIDEIDDDDATEVAHSELACDDLRRLEVVLEYRVVKTAPADEAACIDVDCGERFGLVDNEIAA